MRPFNLNRLLSRDEQSRKRRLYLRTFSVIPLSEDCGIIEWVPNTTGLRHVMQNLYVHEGIFGRHTHNDIKEIYERWKGRNQENALNGITAGIFGASGQSCIAGSRLYIQNTIYDKSFFREKNRRSFN